MPSAQGSGSPTRANSNSALRGKHELYQQCFQRGLERDEFVIFCIEPQETEITLGPVVLELCQTGA